MLAIAAAVVFALALILDVAGYSSKILNLHWLAVLGLLLLALHSAGVGAGFNWRNRGSSRSRQR